MKPTDCFLLRRIEYCINDIGVWMAANLLKVNDDKTVAHVLASRNNQAKHKISVIKIGDCHISPTAINIGSVFDSEMSMVGNVKYICRIAYYHVRNISSIRSTSHRYSETALASREATHSLCYSATDGSCTTRTGTSLHN